MQAVLVHEYRGPGQFVAQDIGGSNMVEYWHWSSIPSGQETYWKGVLSHDFEPSRAYTEVSSTAHELQEIGPHLVNLKIKNDVAILYSAGSSRS